MRDRCRKMVAGWTGVGRWTSVDVREADKAGVMVDRWTTSVSWKLYQPPVKAGVKSVRKSPLGCKRISSIIRTR